MNPTKRGGIRAPASHSYASLEREARIARRRVCPELDDGDPLPSGPSGVFERLDDVWVGPEHEPTWLTYSVSELAPGIEAQAQYHWASDRIEITLSSGTYTEIENHDPRGQFSVCHEVMHGFLHDTLLVHLSVLPHVELALRRQEPHPVYLDTEWQANAGAAAMLMPALGLEHLRLRGRLDTREVMRLFGVSRLSAELRIRVFNDRREELLAA